MKPGDSSRQRAIWLKRMHEWHWISAAVALLGLLFFALTGLTLNHAESFESAKQEFTSTSRAIPASLVTALREAIRQYGEGEAEPTPELRDWIRKEFRIDTTGHMADWKSDEIDFPLERPGGDAWLKLNLGNGMAEYHVTSAGWIAYFNDLHKGRHTGKAWAWFIDALAVGCVIFAITGFVILQMHAKNRSLTWPLVTFGLLVPLLIALLLIH